MGFSFRGQAPFLNRRLRTVFQHLLCLALRCFESCCLGSIAESEIHESHIDAVIESLCTVVVVQSEFQSLCIHCTGALGVGPAALNPPATLQPASQYPPRIGRSPAP